jgi:hypothetical protein
MEEEEEEEEEEEGPLFFLIKGLHYSCCRDESALVFSRVFHHAAFAPHR